MVSLITKRKTMLPQRLLEIANSGQAHPHEVAEMANALMRVHTRRKHPGTSHDAARSVEALTAKRESVLLVLSNYGRGTEEQIADWYALARSTDARRYPGQSPSGLRARRSELVTLGLVRDSGERKRTRYGRQAIVWERIKGAI